MGRAAWIRFWHNIGEGFIIANRALLANKTRTMLTTLGIVIGVVTVTMMMMIIQGLNASFQKQIAFLGSNTVYIQRWPWVVNDDWWKYINRPRLTQELRGCSEVHRWCTGCRPSTLHRPQCRLP